MLDITKHNLSIIEPYELLNGTFTITLPQYRMFQYIIGECYIKDKLEDGKFYAVSIGKYAEFFKCTHDTAYQALTTAMRKGNVPIIDLPESDFTEGAKPTKRRQFILYPAFTYDTETSTMNVRLASELVELYNRLGEEGRSYAKYVLSHTRHMDSISSIRLFRLMNKWRWSTGVYFELDELKRLLGFKTTEYTKWADFYRYVIKPGIEAIHKEAYLEIGMDIKKKGRKVVGIAFSAQTISKKFKKIGELNEKLNKEAFNEVG